MSESQFLRKGLSPITDSYQGSPASETRTIEELAKELIEQRERKELGVVKKTKTHI